MTQLKLESVGHSNIINLINAVTIASYMSIPLVILITLELTLLIVETELVFGQMLLKVLALALVMTPASITALNLSLKTGHSSKRTHLVMEQTQRE